MSTDERIIFGICDQRVIKYQGIISYFKYHNHHGYNINPNFGNPLYFFLGSSCVYPSVYWVETVYDLQCAKQYQN